MFNQDQPYTAIAAAVTFKTFAYEEFVERVAKKTSRWVHTLASTRIRF